MTTVVQIQNKNDWEWYKLSLDVSAKYHHSHYGEPERFPCRVISTWEDDPNGPYFYNHAFTYIQEFKCDKCGHIDKRWSEIDVDPEELIFF